MQLSFHCVGVIWPSIPEAGLPMPRFVERKEGTYRPWSRRVRRILRDLCLMSSSPLELNTIIICSQMSVSPIQTPTRLNRQCGHWALHRWLYLQNSWTFMCSLPNESKWYGVMPWSYIRRKEKNLKTWILSFESKSLTISRPGTAARPAKTPPYATKEKGKLGVSWSFHECPNQTILLDLRTWPFYIRTWPFYQQTTVIRSKQVSWWKAPRLFHCTRKQCTPQQHQECLWQPRWSRWFLVGCIDVIWHAVGTVVLLRNVTLPPVYVPPRMCLCVEPVNLLQQSISICSNACFCRCPKHKLCWQKEWGFMLISLVVSVCNPPSVEKTSHWQR